MRGEARSPAGFHGERAEEQRRGAVRGPARAARRRFWHHPHVASCSLSYDCPACHASTQVLVTGLPEPTASISQRSQETLRGLQATKERLGAAPKGDPVESLAAEILEMSARRTLRYATCPRCGARSPEGLDEQVTDQKRTRTIGSLVSAALAVCVWLFPALAFALVALAAFQAVAMALVARRRPLPFPWLAFLGNLGVTGALLAAAIFFPPAAAAIPPLLGIRFLLYRPADAEAPWKEAAESLRFEA